MPEPMAKTASPKQIAANRRNAQKSTGPRTPAGREASRMNAMKHGILSRQVLVDGRFYSESARELEALQARFWEELQPEGPVEEMLVDQIVTAHWRLRRALTAESGEIALSVDRGCVRRAHGPNPVGLWLNWFRSADMAGEMLDSRAGSAILEGWLCDLRAGVEKAGELTTEALESFVRLCGGKPNSLSEQMRVLRETLGQPADGSNAGAVAAWKKSETLAFLDKQIERAHSEFLNHSEDEECIERARLGASVLPSAGALDKILRYETKLERQIFRAMAQLERVQRMRRGEAIPAPLSVEVSDRG